MRGFYQTAAVRIINISFTMEEDRLTTTTEEEEKKICKIPEGGVPRLRAAAAKRQWLIVILANLSILSSGMGLGFPAVSLPSLTSPLSATQLDQSQASWFASINSISSPLGGILAGFILDKLGRKVSLILINVLSIVAWSLQAWTDKNDRGAMYTQLLAARLIIGE